MIYLILIIYELVVIGVGLFVSRHQRKHDRPFSIAEWAGWLLIGQFWPVLLVSVFHAWLHPGRNRFIGKRS